MLEIRKSRMDDLPRMMELYADARLYMAEQGNPNQWKTAWPPQELIVSDIEAGKSYVCVEKDRATDREGHVIDGEDRATDREGHVIDGEDRVTDREGNSTDGKEHPSEDARTSESEVIVGTFFFSDDPDPTYAVIYDGKWLDDTKQYGVVHRITTDRNTRGVGSFIINSAFGKHHNLRIDTHEQNVPMRRMLEKNGFTACGTIILANGEPRIAFQKVDKGN